MKVKQLKKILEKMNDNDLVILSIDSEGNGFSPLADYSLDSYTPDSAWSGEIALRKLTPKLIKEGYSEEDVASKGSKLCITLWPSN